MKLKLLTLNVLALMGLSSASVVFTVEALTGGGVTLTASGSIDISAMTNHRDGTVASASYEVDATGFRAYNSSDYEIWTVASPTFNTALGSINYDTLDLGSHGNGITMSSTLFGVFGADASAGFADGVNTLPSQTVFEFDFVLTDNDGSLSDYTDGLVLWDSNGVGTTGGEQITFSVVPEPSSAMLLGLASLSLFTRRRR